MQHLHERFLVLYKLETGKKQYGHYSCCCACVLVSCLLWWRDHTLEKPGHTCSHPSSAQSIVTESQTTWGHFSIFPSPSTAFHHHTEEASDQCKQSCGKLKLLTIFCNKSKVTAKFKLKRCKSYCSYMITLSFFMIDIKYKIQIDSRPIRENKVSCCLYLQFCWLGLKTTSKLQFLHI